MKIVFATNNEHKLREIREILGPKFDIVSLAQIGCHEDIPETGRTLEENAHQKAEYVFDHYHISCFADDTGLEVEVLGGAPGVHSARYAEGTDHDSEANMAKLLREMTGQNNRKARFRTVISLIVMEGDNPFCSREYQFEGEGASAPRSRAARDSATTRSSSPKATTAASPSWARRSRTVSATGLWPSASSPNTC